MSGDRAKTRFEGSNELFCGPDEVEADFTELPSEDRHLLVINMIESKEVDAQLVADLFDRSYSASHRWGGPIGNNAHLHEDEDVWRRTGQLVCSAFLRRSHGYSLCAVLTKCSQG